MRLIEQHLANIASALKEFSRIARLSSHPDNIGDAREGMAEHFLSKNLPGSVDYFTGEIFDSNDAVSCNYSFSRKVVGNSAL